MTGWRTMIFGLATVAMTPAWGCGDAGAPSQELVAAIQGGEFLGTDGVTLQEQDADCGPAVLHMLLAEVGIHVPYEVILALHPNPEEFWSFADMREHASSHGLEIRGFRANIVGLRGARLPLVAHLQDHFVLVDSIHLARIHVRDPFVGRLEYTPEAFNEKWTGNVLVLTERESS